MLTHISIQRKLIAYDPLIIPCLCFLVFGSKSIHEGGNDSYSGGVSSTGGKRSPDSESVNSSKRHKGVQDTDSDSPPGIAYFDLASLVQSREGKMKVPRLIQKNLSIAICQTPSVLQEQETMSISSQSGIFRDPVRSPGSSSDVTSSYLHSLGLMCNWTIGQIVVM